MKNGDTIIQILKTHKLRPVFDKKGSLQITLKINKREGKKGYLIREGNILCLPIYGTHYDFAENKEEILKEKEAIVKENETEETLHLDSSLPIVLPADLKLDPKILTHLKIKMSLRTKIKSLQKTKMSLPMILKEFTKFKRLRAQM